ncbi:MAG: hypothetical protein RLZZ543_2329 [Bacteroidota bacterium]|jgi:hypothetical protein
MMCWCAGVLVCYDSRFALRQAQGPDLKMGSTRCLSLSKAENRYAGLLMCLYVDVR